MDEMIILLQESRPRPRNPVRLVRPVVFKAPRDIPILLSTPGAAIQMSTLRPEAAVFVPGTGICPAVPSDDNSPPEITEDISAVQSDQGTNDEEEFVEAEINHVAEAEALAHMEDMSLSQNVVTLPSEEERCAARVIERAYQRYLRRRGSRRGNLAHHFAACLAQSNSMKWTPLKPQSGPSIPRYRNLFLGLVPHLLVCIEHSHTILQTSKTTLKKQLLTARNDALDETGRRLTEVTYVHQGVYSDHSTYENDVTQYAVAVSQKIARGARTQRPRAPTA
jgi:hypothetical protein